MTSSRCVFMRPVVIDSSNDSFSRDGTPDTLTNGTYPNVASVIYELMTQFTAVTGTFGTGSGDAFLLTLDAENPFTLTWTDTALRDLLGFTGNLTGQASYTATYTPQNCWFPSRVRADNDGWYCDHKGYWRGKESISGNVTALVSGSAIYRTTLAFEALNDYECLISRAANAYQRVRSLDYFADLSRNVYGTSATISPAGFYFFPDYTAVTVGNSATYDSGDVTKFDYTASGETFAFCQFDADWYPRYKPTIKVCQTDWFDIDVDIHNATAPTWTGA